MADVFKKLGLVRSVRFRKARALLFFLLHSPEMDHRGEKIADVFWRDYSHDKAMASLRQTIRQVRVLLAELPDIELETRRGHLGLRCQKKTAIDTQVCAALERPNWPANMETEICNYLQEFELLLGVSEAFDSWLTIRNTQSTQAIAEVLERQYAESATSDSAVLAAKLAQVIEPSSEGAVRFLMRYYWAQGQTNRAIETYNQLFDYLGETLDQDPEDLTVQLLARIKLGEAPPLNLTPVEPLSKPRILVQKHSTEGLTSVESSFFNVLYLDLRTRLSRFREWSIIDSGQASGADLLINLQLVSMPPTMLLSIEVTNPTMGALLWAEQIEAPNTNWDEKVRTQLENITNALSLAATTHKAPIEEARIYDRWLSSQVLMDMWSPETEGPAIEMLSDITVDAPRFGPAHAELAGALNVRHILLPGTIQSEAEKQRALHHALEAISLDPLDTRAHRVLGWCYCHKSEFELAGFHFDQALHLNGSNSLTLASCALGFAFGHRLEMAQEIAGRVERAPGATQPFHMIYLAAVNYLCGHYEKTAQQCAEAGDLMTTVGGWHSAALFKLGRKAQAHKRVVEYIESIKTQWSLPGPPNNDDVLDWFASCFPLREESVRIELRQTVGAALITN